MKEKLEQIAEWIKANYKDLPESDIDGKKLVIFATGDFSGEYGYGSSDLNSWGVDVDGKIFWAYASGCSCNCDAGTDEKTSKVLEAMPMSEDDTDLLKQIALFDLDKKAFQSSIGSYNYRSY
jgi:hypothetical protein